MESSRGWLVMLFTFTQQTSLQLQVYRNLARSYVSYFTPSQLLLGLLAACSPLRRSRQAFIVSSRRQLHSRPSMQPAWSRGDASCGLKRNARLRFATAGTRF
jgi:hypothetical protein